MTAPFPTRNVNLRPSALQEFWGTRYETDLYLLPGAKHGIPLTDWPARPIPTVPDPFPTRHGLSAAYTASREYYKALLPTLASFLNDALSTNYPTKFWQIAFGSWLFNYIGIAYDKFVRLSTLDTSAVDLTLAEPQSFYIPYEYLDFHHFFCSDYGVQQLVTVYFLLFSPDHFQRKPIAPPTLPPSPPPSFQRILISSAKRWLWARLSRRPDAVCTGAMLALYFDRTLRDFLHYKSARKLFPLELPELPPINPPPRYDLRENLLQLPINDDPFLLFFRQCLFHGLPKMLLEDFLRYQSAWKALLSKFQIDTLLSEGWIGHFRFSIFVALAKHRGARFVSVQHGASNQILDGFPDFFHTESADLFLTTGSAGFGPNASPGGFCFRNRTVGLGAAKPSDILYIPVAFSPYPGSLQNYALPGARASAYATNIDTLIYRFPPHLLPNLVFRDRPVPFYWDLEKSLSLRPRGIRIDDRYRATRESILNSKVVLIDSFSTALSEVLSTDTPFLIFHDTDVFHLAPQFASLFQTLEELGVYHTSLRSMLLRLTQIWADPKTWWSQPGLQAALEALRSDFCRDALWMADAILETCCTDY